MTDSSDREDDHGSAAHQASRADADPPEDHRPDHQDLHPWMDDPGDEDAEAEDEPPRILQVLGQFGVYLALCSLVLAVGGVVASYFEFRVWGNVAMTLSLAGVSVAMLFGITFQAYVGDIGLGS